MIRIILEKDAYESWNGRDVPRRSQVFEFDDISEARDWFYHDSYFSESYTKLAVWVRIDDQAADPTKHPRYGR